jgi:UDP-2-acetamido-2,6-beta-L-arabino-hexul-4-ose reductase
MGGRDGGEMSATRVLVTGANGFVGKHLCAALGRRGSEVYPFVRGDESSVLDRALERCDIVFHLAGVNRPAQVSEYQSVNLGLTSDLCRRLVALGRAPKLVLSSSVQADRDNPYGASKRAAEETLLAYSQRTGAEAVAYRFKNLFGKWSRPNYNSVVATFCHNIVRGLPISISDPQHEIELTHIDDVIQACQAELAAPAQPGFRFGPTLLSQRIDLQSLADLIASFREQRGPASLPNLERPFVRALYSTYVSHLELAGCAQDLDVKADPRGSLAEVLKSPHFGQIFVSRTRPGITRGNHYHHTKVEKFLVLQGQGLIRLRCMLGGTVVEHHVRGEDYRVVNIPPGCTHSIENVGADELVTLFWSSEPFDPERPDTLFEPVLEPGAGREQSR